MIEFFSYEDFYNIFPVGHSVGEEKIKAYYESLCEHYNEGERRHRMDNAYGMDYHDLCRLMELVCQQEEDCQ